MAKLSIEKGHSSYYPHDNRMMALKYLSESDSLGLTVIFWTKLSSNNLPLLCDKKKNKAMYALKESLPYHNHFIFNLLSHFHTTDLLSFYNMKRRNTMQR